MAATGHPVPRNLDLIIDGKRFRTETATLLAVRRFDDPAFEPMLHDFLEQGEPLPTKDLFLLLSPKGNYFVQVEGATGDNVHKLTLAQAIAIYQAIKNASGHDRSTLNYVLVGFNDAFPRIDDI